MSLKPQYCALLLLQFNVVAFAAESQSTTADSVSLRAAQAEVVHRQELVFSSMQALSDGEKLLASGDLDKAQERLEFARKNLPEGEQAKAARERVTRALFQIKTKLASAALNSSKPEEALKLCLEAQQINDTPEIRIQIESVRQEILKLEESKKNPESLTNNPALTPDFQKKLDVVTYLFFEGDKLVETGQYDKAQERYEKILSLDPYNKAARNKMERVNRLKSQAGSRGRDYARREAFYQIESRWSENIPVETAAVKQSNDQAAPSNVARMTKKLQSITVPKLQFDDVAIEDAVRFLADKSRELDPDKEGVNFVLKKEPTVAPAAPAASTAGAAAGTAVAPAPAPQFTPVTLKLENVTLEQILNFLTNITPLKYKVEENAVFLLPLNESSEILQTRTFAVPPGFFKTALRSSGGSAAISGKNNFSSANAESVKVNVIEELTNKGVIFPSGATAAYLANSNKLVVKNTADQLDVIQALIDSLQQEAPQIEIETKFAEFSEDALKELAFNWYLNLKNNPTLKIPDISSFPASTVFDPLNFFGNFTPGNYQGDISANTRNRSETDLIANGVDTLLQNNTSSLGGAQGVNPLTGGTLSPNTPSTFKLGGIIDGRGFEVLANLIDQTRGVDLLSAPKVTTRSQTAARIEVVREMRYPENYQKPQFSGTPVQFDGQRINLLAPPTPSGFKLQNIGVTMDVTPRAYPDRRIDLDLSPEVVDFEGFINYGDKLRQGTLTTNDIFDVSQYNIQKPVFNIRNMKTKIQVVDGQTVAMGGLIREDNQKIKDKVPFLGDLPWVGRAFRSEVEKRLKKNLIIFVTARLIRSNGKPQFVQTALLVPEAQTENSKAKERASR
jgi:general secretion pathway protein D